MDHIDLSQKQRDLLDSLKEAIIDIDGGKAEAAAEEIVAEKIDLNMAFKYAITDAAIEIGEKFDKGDYYLPHLVMAGDLMEAVGGIFERSIPSEQIRSRKVIVIATVQGDMHSVGKNCVATMLRASGFEIHDMGVDVPSFSIIEKAKEVKADMIALSSLLTTTMPYQKEVVEDLVSMGIRDQFKVMVGGGPVSREFAERIGADGYGKDALDALEEAKKIL